MNVLNAIGNLPRDSEVRFLPDGTAVLGFSFALNAGYGEKQSTSWLNCSLFGRRAERLGELRVNDVTLLGKKDAESPAASTAPAPTAEEEFSEDIPF